MVISSPLFALLDLAVPVLFEAAATAAFVHVPGHYLTKPRAWRDWLQKHATTCCVLANLPVGPMGRRCAWLCLFKSAKNMHRMIKRTPGQAHPITMYI